MKKFVVTFLVLLTLPGFVFAENNTTASQALEIVNSSLPTAVINRPYSVQLIVKGGVAPYQWMTLSTTYPAGCCVLGLNGNSEPVYSHSMTFNTQTSRVVINTFPAGIYYWDIQVEDAAGAITEKTISLNIVYPR